VPNRRPDEKRVRPRAALSGGQQKLWSTTVAASVKPVKITMRDEDVASVLTMGGVGTREPVEYDKSRPSPSSAATVGGGVPRSRTQR
jgi:hypothetical protein